jgi:hypothetical protein
MLAVLFLSRVIKIYQYDRKKQSYKYITKVTLQPGTDEMPIFDGGITVERDVFLI